MLLVTKTYLDAGSTRWAQGGIAAALGEGDSPEEHLRDTLVAGVGLCDEAAVRVLVEEGPARVRELVEIGTQFDRTTTGDIALTREGGHHRDRIAHAGGDATGLEIERALIAALHADPRDRGRRARAGPRPPAGTPTAGSAGSPCTSSAPASATASARCTRARSCSRPAASARSTPRPPTRRCPPATASRWPCAPAPRSPTWSSCSSTRRCCGSGDRSRGQQPLVSEAVRGEGAVLRDGDGARVHAGAPRAGRPRPARRRRQGDHDADARDRRRPRVARRPRLRRGPLAGAVPDHPGQLPGARHRPGHRA